MMRDANVGPGFSSERHRAATNCAPARSVPDNVNSYRLLITCNNVFICLRRIIPRASDCASDTERSAEARARGMSLNRVAAPTFYRSYKISKITTSGSEGCFERNQGPVIGRL